MAKDTYLKKILGEDRCNNIRKVCVFKLTYFNYN